MRMTNFLELPPFARTILKGAKISLHGLGAYLSAHVFVVRVLVPRSALPSSTELGREGYTLFICSRSTSRRGIHTWAGHHSGRVFGTSGPVT